MRNGKEYILPENPRMFKIAFAILMSVVSLTANASYQTEFENHLQPRFEKMQPLILEVARRQNVDPVLLTTTVYTESRFNPEAKNRKSSARGATQMLKSTRLAMIKRHGKELGIPRNADIHDPEIALKLGAAYLKDIEKDMRTAMRRSPSSGEIYLGFKYGPGTAASLIKAGKHRKSNGTIAKYRKAAAFYADLTPAAPKKVVKKHVQLAFATPEDNLNDLQGVWKTLYGNAIPKPNPDAVIASNSLSSHYF
jgi:soluble lytic murein transglycosylase-like protein